MRIRQVIFLLVFMALFVKMSSGDDLEKARALFYEGNNYYSGEKFEEAIADYEKALSLGFESGQLYYNLGNAYFKRGSLGKAILNYLRAGRLMPEDADLKSNLNYARSLIKGGPVEPRRKWPVRIFLVLADSFSLDRAALLVTILYFALVILFVLVTLVKRLRKISGYIVVPVSILLAIFVSLFLAQLHKTLQKVAVVITERSDCKFEPLSGATTFYTLNEGENVVVVGSKKDWVKVRRPDGKQGWILRSDIEFL
ncbi:MAG: hypothetical protein A2Z72_02070 [Omnitrophica bacterium RBG_13_46_9]|nr:MAG: hypothetical protein A2Z72_02070 [Omnitrophica bacterium RBG_13_46_9]